MQIVTSKITLDELKKMSEKMDNELVKAVVDIDKGIMVVDAGMHADEEMLLLEEHDSLQENLWGINIYPHKSPDQWIEFNSMINLRPSYGNKTRGVDDPAIQKRIKELVLSLVRA